MRLSGWRLPDPAARVYVPIVPQAGRFASEVLQLDLVLEEERLRFFFGTAPLAEAEELVARLEKMVTDVSERANELDRRLAAALEELDRLRAK